MPDRFRNDPFGRSRLPASFDREGRVRLLGEIFTDLLEGRMPSVEGRMLLGSAGSSWLEIGGNLERDHLRVTAPHRSTLTPARLWRRIKANALQLYR